MDGRVVRLHANKVLLGPGMIRETSEKIDLIRRRMKVAQDRQKSYADKRRTELEFDIRTCFYQGISVTECGSLWIC